MTTSPAPWQVVGSETVVEDRWISVRSDDCRDADGRSISPYYVLQYGDWISVLALDHDENAIVVEEYRHGAGIVALGTIGGGVEAGETPSDAAARELLEETGHVADELVGLGATWANFGSHTNRVHHFLAVGCSHVAEQSLDHGETIATHVLSLDGLGEHLAQSYHQLTWYKAMEWLDR
ncbi:NUDIX hydrolase [Microbacterium sp. SD291]|uniref:NUDIX hydrolase n=1 Tax=Microbacterium sp. SD291 TaxID=2782007 RepID=UPI001A968A71|nr:NUDIX hydrolase [Microbacterium sp. SD291]MBO0979851.1 NUDIX hydrolase [Microbacterium sp. SD291]